MARLCYRISIICSVSSNTLSLFSARSTTSVVNHCSLAQSNRSRASRTGGLASNSLAINLSLPRYLSATELSFWRTASPNPLTRAYKRRRLPTEGFRFCHPCNERAAAQSVACSEALRAYLYRFSSSSTCSANSRHCSAKSRYMSRVSLFVANVAARKQSAAFLLHLPRDHPLGLNCQKFGTVPQPLIGCVSGRV
jgi:hypothetical protein